MSEQPIVRLNNVTKRIGRKTIIDRLTFNIPRGEIFGFLGPNGAGKTTTIRMMVGLMSITQGDILINGHSIKNEYEKAIGYVGGIVENPEMYKYLTGYQNLLHYSRMHPGVTKERIDEMVRLVGLQSRIHDKVKTYSLGMRQRLGVAQALLHRPQLLILDEPTNGLDPAGIRELRDYLRLLTREEGITVFVSSHLLSEMELMCDRVAIIQGGKLIDVRTLNEYIHDIGSIVTFAVNQPSVGKAVAEREFPSVAVELHKDGFSLSVSRDDVPRLNAELVKSDVLVYEIKVKTKSLEDKFLEITGGESVAELASK